VIDAGYEPPAVAEAVKGLRVRSILVTHGHRDHHEHARELRDVLGVPLGIGVEDVGMLGFEPDFTIQDGQSLPFGSQALQAIHTPGHTPGSTCFHVQTHLFTGDTLFPGGPGNTQKDPRRFARIIDSIRERLFVFGDETMVYPGHGRDTTLGAERPHLGEWIERGW
jgi:glyoxylase-like metal-dependent hydrolase (beta-lactamase superfamily II)